MDKYNNWINHPIEVNGKIPQAHLEKYNRAIIKSLAYKGMEQDFKQKFGNWKKAEEELEDGTINLIDKRFLDEKLDERVNKGGESQWLRFVKGEQY